MRRHTFLLLLVLAWLCPMRAWAADHATANETIWPTQNDVAQTAGNGKKMLENQWAKPLAVLNPNSYTLSGLTVPGSSGSLNINVALGNAYIAGRHITIPGATAVTAAASQTNFLFLKLTRDGGSLVTGASFEVNTSGISPADSILLATLTAGASTITSTADLRTFPGRIQVLTSGTEWTVPAGIRQIYVEVIGASGGGGGGGGADGGAGDSTDGGSGGTGGTTTFSGLSVSGGTGGSGGFAGDSAAVVRQNNPFGSPGAGSGGFITSVGRGHPGGVGGSGGGGVAAVGVHGYPGGEGGYAASPMDVTQDTDITLSIGAAGTGGTGGTGVSSGGNGSAGSVGQAGKIFIHY